MTHVEKKKRGRPRKYSTREESEEAQRQRSLSCYHQHKENYKDSKRQYYYNNRERILAQKKQAREELKAQPQIVLEIVDDELPSNLTDNSILVLEIID